MASSPDPDISFNINNNENDRPSPLAQHSTTGHGDQRVHMSSYSAPSIPTRLAHDEPDLFSGTENYELYLSHFEACDELSDWSDRVKVLVLSSKFKGNARNLYTNVWHLVRLKGVLIHFLFKGCQKGLVVINIRTCGCQSVEANVIMWLPLLMI